MSFFRVVAIRSVVEECVFIVEAEDDELLDQDDVHEKLVDYADKSGSWDVCDLLDEIEIDHCKEMTSKELKRYGNKPPVVLHFTWPETEDKPAYEPPDPRQLKLV